MENPMDLPSFNLSKYMNIENGAVVLELMNNIKTEDNPTSLRRKVQSRDRAPSVSPQPGTSSGISAILIEEQRSGFKFADGTEPIDAGAFETISPEQIMNQLQPELEIQVKDPYSRFRYESEKSKERKRQRHIDAEDPDKQCLAAVQVKNYTGPAKVIAHCVDSKGQLHPFHLFGPNCNRGVYVRRFKFRPEKIHRLNGVSVIMPTSKNIGKFTDEKVQYLEECGVQCQKPSAKENQDKQMVFVKFHVILEDTNMMLEDISTALCNRKQGKEFCIDTILPPSAPANGRSDVNVQSNMVIVIVTNHTLFPAEPGVIIRERGGGGTVSWEVIVHPKDLDVIKKAVVKFTPPPYKIPDISSNVNVELCLCDMKTKVETDPVSFTYRGSDVYGVEGKGKKRKHMAEDANMYQQSSLTGRSPDVNRQVLTAMRKNKSSTVSYEHHGSSSSGGSTPDLSQVGPETSDPSYTSQSMNLPQTMTSGENQQASDMKSGSLPFSSYGGQQGVTQQGQMFMQSQFEPLTPLVSQEAPLSAGFTPNTIVTSVTPGQVTATTQMPVYQTATVTSNYSATGSNQGQIGYQQLPFNNQLNNQQAQQMVTASQQQNPNADLLQNILPGLQPNQQIAVINGQIFIVNDDTGDQAAAGQGQGHQFVQQNLVPNQAVNNSGNVQPSMGQVQNPPQPFQGPAVTSSQNQQGSNVAQALGSQTQSLSSANIAALISGMAPEQVAQVTAFLQTQMLAQQTQQQQLQQQQLLQQPVAGINQYQGYDDPNQGGYASSNGSQESSGYNLNDDDDIEVDGVGANEEVAEGKAEEKESDNSDFKKPLSRKGKKLRTRSRDSRENNETDEDNVQMVILEAVPSTSQIPTCVMDSDPTPSECDTSEDRVKYSARSSKSGHSSQQTNNNR